MMFTPLKHNISGCEVSSPWVYYNTPFFSNIIIRDNIVLYLGQNGNSLNTQQEFEKQTTFGDKIPD